ncbi:MAG: hypothetical protein WDA16_12900 [Candidatus Thermoplasmatota archaeon]
MIEKLRSRRSIDLPAEGWKNSRRLLAVLGGLAALFVILPLALALYGGARDHALGIVLGVSALVLALVVGAALGKPGHARR